MRIALVIERFESGGGGVENVAWRVAHGLAAAGDEVHVVARRATPSAQVQIHQVGVPSLWQPARVLAFSRAAARTAPRGGFDVVHSFSRTRHQDLFRAGGGSHADYMERSYSDLGRRARRFSPRHATLLSLERRVFRDETQLVQCNSEMVRDELIARYGLAPERLVVLCNGVDVERFHPDRRAEVAERVRQAEDHRGGLIWLWAGSGFHRKGLDTTLHAMAASHLAETRLWVAGRDDPGPWRAMAAALGLAGRVRFLGPRRDLEDVYAASDALVLPTRYDAFANVCLEAAAAGLPVVTSGANGAARWLGDAGLVVEDPEDVAGLAKALDRLGDPALRAQLGRAARRRAEAQTWQHHVTALREIYARIQP